MDNDALSGLLNDPEALQNALRSVSSLLGASDAGAHENGLPAIGVLYGYGGREELENAGADYLAADLHELKQLLLQE